MRVGTRIVGWLGALALALPAQAAPPAAETLLLSGARIIDGTGAAAREGLAVLVVDGRIARIGPAEQLAAEAGEARRVDLAGHWLTPGFVDAHAHILDPASAGRALRSGVTTVRVLGDSYLRGLGTRDLVRAGHVEGPEMLTAGAIVRPVLGEGVIVAFPQFGEFLDEPMRGAENVSAVVDALLDRGVDVIKVGASERAGLITTDPRRPELDEEEIRAAVDLAGRRGKFVAAHAHAAAGAEAAVRAGVRSIEHGTYTRPETLRMMAERGTWLVPTLAVMSPLADPPGDSAAAAAMHHRIWHMQSALHAVVREALALGVRIAAATDGSYGDGDETAVIRVQHEIAELVALGMTPLQAIAAATSSGAELLGIEQRTGRVAEGLEADLLVFDRDPETDLRVLFEPLMVVSDGKVVVDRLY